MKNIKQKQKNLFEMLSTIKDCRRLQGRRHSIGIILIIAIMATMSGYFGIRAMKDFTDKNRRKLLDLFKPKNGELPSRQTIGRVLQHLDFDELSNIFYEWSLSYAVIEKHEWISIDGKAIKGTVSDCSKAQQRFISLVSIFASKKKQILTAGKINNKKESEIPKVKNLIRMLDLTGVIFTIDALHCQKNTTKTIVKSGNDYCIGVKGNQKSLHTQIKKTSNQVKR